MDFGLSSDQLLLEQTVRGFLSDRIPIDRVRELRDMDCPNDRGHWAELAELGIAGIRIPEAEGGSALGLLDVALASQSLGYAVTPSPFLSSAVMVPVALSEISDSDAPLSEAWLSGIASGELTFGVAITEAFSVREDAGIRETGGSLSGKSLMALDARSADLILVSVGTDSLAVIRTDAPGLTINALETIDTTRCTSELVLEAVAPEAVMENCRPAIERMLDAGRIALAADSLGAAEAMIERAVAYSLERKQFDRTIGSFQAVKHMCAEMIADLEPARSLLWYAAHSFDAVPDEAPLMACQAQAHISEIGHQIASLAIQVHGGIGWTDEQNVHFWFKRIGLARHLLGGPEFLRDRAAQLQGLAQAS